MLFGASDAQSQKNWTSTQSLHTHPPVMKLIFFSPPVNLLMWGSIMFVYHPSATDPDWLLFTELQCGLELWSFTPVTCWQHVSNCHGFVQLVQRAANSPIKLEQSLIPLSLNRCRSIPQGETQPGLDKCRQSDVFPASITEFLPPLHTERDTTDLYYSIKVLSGSSK